MLYIEKKNIMQHRDQLLGEVYDILKDMKHRDAKLYGGKGGVTLIDCNPRMCPKGRNLDYAAARAARTSYNSGLKGVKADEGLVRFLVRHKHTSPLEFISMTFLIKCPIFVARQIMRHRTASVNEVSARYTELPDVFYVPEKGDVRVNNTHNKQSSGGSVENEQKAIEVFEKANEESYRRYQELLSLGVSREQARSVLPVGIFTQFYFTMNLNNLLKFLTLRKADDCQKETRVVADQMYEMMLELCPVVMNAWWDYHHASLSLTHPECVSIETGNPLSKHVSKGEKREFKDKLRRLNIPDDFLDE